MAENLTIARPYAEAVFKLALEKSALDKWAQTLALLEAIVRDPQVAQRLGDPNVGDQKIEALIAGVSGDKLDAQGRNFVHTLLENNRLTLLPEIRVLFEQLKQEQEGVVEVQIYSALPLDDAQTKQVISKIEASPTYARKKVRAQVSVDPQLIGGIKIVVGDTVFDATVRGKLDTIVAALTY